MSDEEPDEDLIELISLALVGRINLKVSDEAFREVEGTADPDKRAKRIARLETFGRLTIPQHRQTERDALARRLTERSSRRRSRVAEATSTTSATVGSWQRTS
jgi:hypothetical protein